MKPVALYISSRVWVSTIIERPMSFDINDDGQDTISDFMAMTVYSVISDTLSISLDAIKADANLVTDLGMNEQSQEQLVRTIREMFDGLLIDVSDNSLVQDIIDQVLQNELDELEYDESEFLDSVY